MHVDGMAEYGGQVVALSDSLTMSLLIGVDTTCIMLRQLRQRLLDAASKLQLLVPDTVYLPAPPVYCPQPAVTAEVVSRCSCLFGPVQAPGL